MMGEGPENVTCARDLARGLAALDEPRILEALSVAHDSELPHRLPEHEVLVKTGEIWPRVYHEVALVDRRLGPWPFAQRRPRFRAISPQTARGWSGPPSIEARERTKGVAAHGR